MSLALAVYGGGRTGLAVAERARERGLEVTGLWTPRPLPVERAGRAAGFEPRVGGEPPAIAADAWLLAVPDDAVHELAARLAPAVHRTGVRPRVAAHCAGALGVEALEPLAAAGVTCGSWHPVMTLHGGPDDAVALGRARVAIDGTEEARAVLVELSEALGTRWIDVAGVDRPRYHAALVLAGNGRVALDAAALGLLAEAGIDADAARALLSPLVARTDANLAAGPAAAALTGPVARGDAETVRRQLEALAAEPELQVLYRALGRVALALVPGDGRAAGHDAVEHLLQEPVPRC